MAALDDYVDKTNKRIFYEYILIKDLNDTDACARQLGNLLRNRLAHVNLIPYNPGDNLSCGIFAKPEKERVKDFQETLKSFGIPVTLRHTM